MGERRESGERPTRNSLCRGVAREGEDGLGGSRSDLSQHQRSQDLSRLWRILRTGLCFVEYGVGGLTLGLGVLPLVGAATRDPRTRHLRAQRVIHHGYRVFVGTMERVGVIEVHLHGGDRIALPGPKLLVCNHPSLIDSAILGSLLPQVDCVAADGWADNRYIRRAVDAAGYLRNGDGVEVVERGVRRLREGRTLMMFPEGTRSPRGGLGRFHRGAAHVALRSGCDITPIVIRQDPPSLLKGQKWHDVPERTMRYDIRVEEPLVLKDCVPDGERHSLAARRLTATLREFFSKRLETGRLD